MGWECVTLQAQQTTFPEVCLMSRLIFSHICVVCGRRVWCPYITLLVVWGGPGWKVSVYNTGDNWPRITVASPVQHNHASVATFVKYPTPRNVTQKSLCHARVTTYKSNVKPSYFIQVLSICQFVCLCAHELLRHFSIYMTLTSYRILTSHLGFELGPVVMVWCVFVQKYSLNLHFICPYPTY